MSTVPVRSKEQFLTFGAPHIGEPEIMEVVASLRSGWIGTGPKVSRFEKEFAAYREAQHAVAVHSCTAALHLSLIAAELPPGSEVITTPLTFCATVNAIIHAGLTPVLADIDPVTRNIDPEKIEAAITGRTSAIIPVHFAGIACNMERIMAIARKHDLTVIEDCAHAIETTYNGKSVGTFGTFGCFSFYVTKNLTTGEGGMVLTSDAKKAARIKRLALHGMSADAWNRYGDEGYKHYYVVESGFKYNMMDIQAAIGLHQLEKVRQSLDKRRMIRKKYDTVFSSLPLTLPFTTENSSEDACHLYSVLVDEQRTGVSRDSFLQKMTWHGIGVGVHYLSLPEHPYYQNRFGWNPDRFPEAKKVGRETVSLPLSPKLTDKDVDDVIAAVLQVLGD